MASSPPPIRSQLTDSQRGQLGRQLYASLDALQSEAIKRRGGLSEADFARQTLQEDADDAVQLAGAHEVEAAYADVDSHEADEIKAAIDRLPSPDFGVCEECGMPIPLSRLTVEPQARRCEMCETRQELRRS